MLSSLPELLFITNPDHEDQEEDAFLGKALRSTFNVIVASPKEAPKLLVKFSRCLLRNAWPSRLFIPELQMVERVSKERGIKMYNPVHRGYIENKSYLERLWRDGYPVIPTISSRTHLDQLPSCETYIVKPNDGCSSVDVESLTREQISKRDVSGSIIQPELVLRDEISFYFIDDVLAYTMVSGGKGKRWDLTEYDPSDEEIHWAKQFVTWNKLPYGIQRIDAGRTEIGELFLMEVEDQMCYLSLLDLPEESREKACDMLIKSVELHIL